MTNQKSEGLGTGRIEALTDGIFAIAMTLLVLTIDNPDFPSGEAAVKFPGYLRSLWPDFCQYVLAFITLASFWMSHHQQSKHIKRIDSNFIWLNILALIVVALIPFSTHIAGDYGNLRLGAQVFEVNLLFAGLLFWRQWRYATKDRRLVEADLSPDLIRRYRQGTLIIPGLSLLALALSFITPSWSMSVYFLIPLFYHRGLIRRKLAGKKG